jgi:uncharacterized protein with PQ loop repeat
MIATTIGWIGSVCFAFCGIPQAIRVARQGHADGLSPWFLIFWVLGEVCYVAAVLLEFGWVGWMMFNYLVNLASLTVICRYYFWPTRKRNTVA